MALATEELYDKAIAMSADVEDNFLDLARTLRQLLDRDSELFQQVYQKTNLGRRKAYYLVEVSRKFDPLPVSRVRLKKVGWTKLQIIGKYANKDNVLELVDLAEKHTAKELEAIVKGEDPITNAHCVLMYFSPKQYAALEQKLLENGGHRSVGGRGIVNKEEALLKALKVDEGI